MVNGNNKEIKEYNLSLNNTYTHLSSEYVESAYKWYVFMYSANGPRIIQIGALPRTNLFVYMTKCFRLEFRNAHFIYVNAQHKQQNI